MEVRTFSKIILLWVLIVLAASCSSVPAGKAKKVTNSVILISIDGLRPEFYSERFKTLAPHLYQFAHSGVSAPDGMEPVFPTLTYPNHASLVTGVSSSQHGILSNRVEGKGEDAWYFNESSFQAPTLWQAAEKKGLSVAILHWPTTLGVHAQWYLPEIFGPGFNSAKDWELIKAHTDPVFLDQLVAAGKTKTIENSSDIDLLTLQAAKRVFSKDTPDLTLLHFIDVDLVEHQTGTHSPETRVAVSRMDHLVSEVVALADPEHATVFIVGDHGFADVGRTINLHSLFPKFADQIEIQAEGGQAGIYLKPGSEKLAAEVIKILKAHAKSYYKILMPSDLKDLKAYPQAICAVETMPGTQIISTPSPDFVQNLGTTRGAHGYLPERLEMQTGFIAWGHGVEVGREIEYTKLLDVAPTVASVLAIPFQGEGKVIKLMSEQKPVLPSGSPSP